MNYLLLLSVCLGVSYAVYKGVYRRSTEFAQMRFFLLSAMVLSVLVPLSNFGIEIGMQEVVSSISVKPSGEEPGIELPNEIIAAVDGVEHNVKLKDGVVWKSVILRGYMFITLFFMVRIIAQLYQILYTYLKSKKTRQGRYIYVYNNRYENTFSFFKLIFINRSFNSNNNSKSILLHEEVHASQYHSIDVLMIELLAAVMWFNPVVWMIRKEVQLVHEYLADEGALSTGIDRLKYQALLINQITEERLICLSSSFNHSLIKKRMIMMTKQKFNQGTKLKTLMVIPLAVMLLLSVACINGQDREKTVAAIAPTKMNVLYIGVDNPVNIAVSGYSTEDLNVEVDNGKIEGDNGVYIIRPGSTGIAIVKVSVKDELIQEAVFRVKTVPQPVVKIAGIPGGAISKTELLEQKGIEVVMENFDFDLKFTVVGFAVSATVEGFVHEASSETDELTENQKQLIQRLEKGNRVYIQDVQCKGPDGKTRNLPAIALLLN